MLISALAQTEEVAVALVPIAIIPLIILAGVIAPLRGLGEWLADALITARWGAQALKALVPDETLNLLQTVRPAYRMQLAMVAVHVLVFAVATFLVLWRHGCVKRSV